MKGPQFAGAILALSLLAPVASAQGQQGYSSPPAPPPTMSVAEFDKIAGQQSGTYTPPPPTSAPPSVTEFVIPTSNVNPDAITKGPDGNIWWTEDAGNARSWVGTMQP